MIYLILILFSFLTTLLVSLYLAKNPVALSIPTERGLHEITTPTSGGLALFAGFVLGAIIMEFVNYGFYSIQTLIIFSVITLIGFLDDKYGVSKTIRFLTQIGLALLATSIYADSWFISFLLTFFIVYFINAYNFMDGIDSLITFQSIFALIAFIILIIIADPAYLDYKDLNTLFLNFHPEILLIIILIAFSFFNFTPAKLFLGNSGSYFLGMFLSYHIIFINYTFLNPENTININFITSFIVFTVILVDTIYVIIRRLVYAIVSTFTKENKTIKKILVSSIKHITEAHCTHNYQQLTKKTHSHSRAVLLLMLYNILWCLPLAIISVKFSEYSVLCLSLSCIPYSIWCYINNAGVETN